MRYKDDNGTRDDDGDDNDNSYYGGGYRTGGWTTAMMFMVTTTTMIMITIMKVVKVMINDLQIIIIFQRIQEKHLQIGKRHRDLEETRVQETR